MKMGSFDCSFDGSFNDLSDDLRLMVSMRLFHEEFMIRSHYNYTMKSANDKHIMKSTNY